MPSDQADRPEDVIAALLETRQEVFHSLIEDLPGDLPHSPPSQISHVRAYIREVWVALSHGGQYCFLTLPGEQ